MKKIFTSLLLLASGMQCFAQVTWTTPVTVYSTTPGGNYHPRIALNRAGDPYIIWGRNDTRVYFSKWNGSGFTTPTVPSGSLTTFAQSWAGPDLAAYGDTVYVSMKVTPENVSSNYIYLAHSYDGGSTFSAPVRVDNIDTNISRFPIVTTTANGNPMVAFMKFNASFSNAHYVVSRSADYGNTFSADVLASGATGTVCDCCPAAIVSSGSTAVMLFRNNISNIRDTWAGISSDNGMTFPTTLNVDAHNWMLMSCPASGPDGLIIGDTLYTTFYSKASGTDLVYFGRSSISGLSVANTPVTGTFSGLTSQNYPRIANSGGAAAIVWKQVVSGTTSVACAFTSNILSGFSGYTTVASGSGIANADVALSPGVVHVVWEDDNSDKVMYMKGTYSLSSTGTPVVTKEVIDVFPDPASGYFTARLNNVGNISYTYLVDMSGRRHDITPVISGNSATFSTDGMAKGNYYFVLGNVAGNIYYSRMVIQ